LIYARALMLVDGSSDEPLGRHVAALARRHEVRLDVVTPEFERMNMPRVVVSGIALSACWSWIRTSMRWSSTEMLRASRVLTG
jgi:hypothetical protein